MKKTILAATVSLLTAVGVAFAAPAQKTDTKTELRPTQKIMQARNAWMKSMNENFNAGNLAAIRKDAEALGTQTRKVAEKLTDPAAKEYSLAIAALTKDVIANSAKKDSAATLTSLRELKNKCGSCHIVFRDKK